MKNFSKGMTLIELIMIIAIGSALVGGVVLFTHQLVRSGTQTRDYLIAMDLGEQKMAEMNNAAFVTLPPGTTNFLEASFPGFGIRRVITDETSSAVGGFTITLRRIEMLVDYAGGTFANPLVRLITFRHSHTSFGNGA